MVSRVHRYPLLSEPETVDEVSPRVLLLGTCGLAPISVGLSHQAIPVTHILWESLSFSPSPAFEQGSYDAIVISVTLLHIFADAAALMEPDRAFGNAIYLPRAIAAGREREFFEVCSDMIRQRLSSVLPLCSETPTFVLSFLEPKHNYLGNLMPRYDLSNPAFFVQKLNESLAENISAYKNVRFFDTNELINLVGRARIQDDYTTLLGHGSIMQNDETDHARIQTSKAPWEMWEPLETLQQFEQLVVRRLLDDLAILRAPLTIKAIIVDVDDTLWRGIAVEEPDKPHWEFTEGWPLGFAEALLFFKARGGTLAICTNNDANALRGRWPHIYQGRLRLADFASMKINFDRKSDNVRSILSDLNVLPQNVLFVDDNPREIDEVRASFPDMHFMSADHHDWRRKVLMLPQMQVASLNADTALRTSSVQANAVREQARQGMSFEDWLRSLELRQTIEIIEDSDHRRFERAFELINKTNQFNTTGKRWDRAEMRNFLQAGGYLICSSLRDKFADNGMICVMVVKGPEIVQVVLSCRAFKYSVEIAAGVFASDKILAKHEAVIAHLIDTGKNGTCQNYFANLGFSRKGDEWVGTSRPPLPTHLALEVV